LYSLIASLRALFLFDLYYRPLAISAPLIRLARKEDSILAQFDVADSLLSTFNVVNFPTFSSADILRYTFSDKSLNILNIFKNTKESRKRKKERGKERERGKENNDTRTHREVNARKLLHLIYSAGLTSQKIHIYIYLYIYS